MQKYYNAVQDGSKQQEVEVGQWLRSHGYELDRETNAWREHIYDDAEGAVLERELRERGVAEAG